MFVCCVKTDHIHIYKKLQLTINSRVVKVLLKLTMSWAVHSKSICFKKLKANRECSLNKLDLNERFDKILQCKK